MDAFVWARLHFWLFYVRAVPILNGLFAVQMSNLIVFLVTFGSQLMTFRTCSIFVLYILTNFFFHSQNVTKSTHLTTSLFSLATSQHKPPNPKEISIRPLSSQLYFSHVSYPLNHGLERLEHGDLPWGMWSVLYPHHHQCCCFNFSTNLLQFQHRQQRLVQFSVCD